MKDKETDEWSPSDDMSVSLWALILSFMFNADSDRPQRYHSVIRYRFQLRSSGV